MFSNELTRSIAGDDKLLATKYKIERTLYDYRQIKIADGNRLFEKLSTKHRRRLALYKIQ